MHGPLTELKIPAHADFIPVAKRVASTLGGQLGFSIEELDELKIAVAQACDSAIETAAEHWGDSGSLKLSYSSTPRGIEVEVQAVGPRSPQELRPKTMALPPRDQERVRLANEMIRCFVDDFRSQTGRGGRVRYRMVKYLIG